jgi:peptide subunit release factor 1 (eRF1)
MSEPRYADLLSLRLTCSDPQCGQSFQKSIAQLASRGAVPCPRCNKPVDLDAHRAVIDRLVEMVAALERPAS